MKRNKLPVLFLCLALMLLPTSGVLAYEEDRATLDGELTAPSEDYLDYLELEEETQVQTRMPLPLPRPSSLETPSGKMGGADLPSSYDARTEGYLPPVLDQGNTSSCWTFSAVENLAGYLNFKENQPGETGYSFSPRHMEFTTAIIPQDLMFSNGLYREADAGGNQMVASLYLMGGLGPVDNSGSMAFQNYPLDANGKPQVVYPTRAELLLSPTAEVTDYIFLPELDEGNLSASRSALMKQMKQAVLDYGTLDVGIDWVDSNKYFNTEYNCFYNPNGKTTTNHAVLLVGWDDGFSRNNFNSGYKPQSDGAWIIQNSWGSDVQENGFFYVSYEELSIYELSSTVAGAGSEISYDKAYVLDPMGINSSFVSNQDTATYWAANVFSKEAGTELLTSVNLSLWGSTSYEIYVTDGSLSLSGLTPAASGSADMLGYLSVTLDTPIELTGDQFAVIVKYSLRNGASIPVECNIGDYYRYVDAPSHSSFLSENGRSWAEISTADWDYSNLCIKAFTQSLSGQTVLHLENENPKALFSVYRPNKEEVPMRADGSFLLAQNSRYIYQCDSYSPALQPDGGHMASFQNSFTTGEETSLTLTAKSHPLPFSDVSVFSWYFDSVVYCYENSLVNGVTPTEFSPESPATRAELVTLLWRMEGQPKPNSLESFPDVPQNTWYSEAVAWAAENGVVNGNEKGLFVPGARIIRQDFAVMLYRYQDLVHGSDVTSQGQLSAYTDANKISNYAKDAMSWCVAEKILNGRTATTLAPQGTILRSETAAMLQRLLAPTF